jgi:hypothetical protein
MPNLKVEMGTRQVSFSFFLAWSSSCFCRGFREKRGAERGFLMVKSWWNAGKRWSENDLKSTLKIFHGFQVYFWAFPFWEWEELG